MIIGILSANILDFWVLDASFVKVLNKREKRLFLFQSGDR